MHAVEKYAIRIPNGKARLHERTGAVTLLCSDLVQAAVGQPVAATATSQPHACGDRLSENLA
jgi:hypothetical protein